MSADMVGRTRSYDATGESMATGDLWHEVKIFLNTSSPGPLSDSTTEHKEKVILHEMGHAMKLAHSKQMSGIETVTGGRGGYADDSSVLALMNQGNPTPTSSNSACRTPKKHDIINLKNKWGE